MHNLSMDHRLEMSLLKHNPLAKVLAAARVAIVLIEATAVPVIQARDTKMAKRYYEKSLRLDPKSASARENFEEDQGNRKKVTESRSSVVARSRRVRAMDPDRDCRLVSSSGMAG